LQKSEPQQPQPQQQQQQQQIQPQPQPQPQQQQQQQQQQSKEVLQKKDSSASITNASCSSSPKSSFGSLFKKNSLKKKNSSAGSETNKDSSKKSEELNELNARNTSLSSNKLPRDYIPYGGIDHPDYAQYYEEGWYQDEFGDWYQDPEYAALLEAACGGGHLQHPSRKSSKSTTNSSSKKSSSQSDKNQNAQMPSSTAMSDNAYSSSSGQPDNYEEGWYQDESGNWLNQFDWKQVRNCIYICFCDQAYIGTGGSCPPPHARAHG
jgi:hypothetical protein